MATPWDGIMQMPWFQNMMRSRQGSAPGNMMSQLMNRGGQQFGNMRSNLMAGMNQLSPNPPTGTNQPPNPPAGTMGLPGATGAGPSTQPGPTGPPPNPPAGLGASIMQPPNPPGFSAGLGTVAGSPTAGSPGMTVGPTMVSLDGGPARPSVASSLPSLAHGGAVNHEPTDGQKKAGNYKKRHIIVHGLDISIENEKGSIRSGKDKGGKPWSVKMPAPYGYIRSSEGADGDHVDCYIGPHVKSPNIWVVNQIDADSKRWDEHKCFIGFASEAQVRRVYAAAFSDGKGHRRIGSIRKMSVDEFKNWLKEGNTTKPVARAA